MLFFKEWNAKNVDGALALVRDNVIFKLGANKGIGKNQLKPYMLAVSGRGVTFTASNFNQYSAIAVDFVAKASDGNTFNNCNAMVADGEIIALTIK